MTPVWIDQPSTQTRTQKSNTRRLFTVSFLDETDSVGADESPYGPEEGPASTSQVNFKTQTQKRYNRARDIGGDSRRQAALVSHHPSPQALTVGKL